MGKIRQPVPVKLVVPMFSAQEEPFALAQEALIGRFGPPDYVAGGIAFAHTRYYEQEFGSDLERRFLSFERLVDPGELADIKLFTNELELRLGQRAGEHIERRINLDPGYLTLGKFVLATTKNHAHRIYLQKGIYAEVTLDYHSKDFLPWPWTYPDYRTEEYLKVLREIRRLYAAQLRQMRAQGLIA